MRSERIFQVLGEIHPISEEFKTALRREITSLSLPKGYHLLEASNISEQAYFLEQGFVMSYSYANGKRQIENLWSSGQIILSPTSFFEQVPSTEYIQLLIDSEVVHINFKSVNNLLKTYPEAEAIYRKTMNFYFERARERVRDMQYSTSEEQYEKLIGNHPSIEQILSQEQIASYLGIAPQSLSRLKRNKS